MKPSGYIAVVLGFITLAGPHHLLPTRTYTTLSGVILKEQCYSWKYHPELYLGLVVILLGALLTRGRHRGALSVGVVLFGVLLLASAYMMQPPEYYLKMVANLVGIDYNPYIWPGRNSIRAHIGIRYVLAFLGLAITASGYSGYRGWEIGLGTKQRTTASYLALQNLGERPFRSWVLVFMVAVAAATLFSGTILIKGSQGGLESLTGRLGADIAVVPEGQELAGQEIILGTSYGDAYMEQGLVEKVSTIPGVERVTPQLYAGTLEYEHRGTQLEAGVVGFDATSDFLVRPWLWISQYGLEDLGPKEAITGRAVKFSRGQKIPIKGESFEVAGTLKWTGIAFFDYAIFIDLEEAGRLEGVPADSVSVIYVKVAPGTDTDRVAEILEDEPGISAVPVQRSTTMVRERLEALMKMFLVLTSALWLFALAAIYIIFSMTVNERDRETGVMRALGASKTFLFGLFTREAVFLGLTGGILGTILGGTTVIAFENLIKKGLKVPFVWPGDTFVILLVIGTIILSVAVGALGAAVSVRKSLAREPYDLIRIGE